MRIRMLRIWRKIAAARLGHCRSYQWTSLLEHALFTNHSTSKFTTYIFFFCVIIYNHLLLCGFHVVIYFILMRLSMILVSSCIYTYLHLVVIKGAKGILLLFNIPLIVITMEAECFKLVLVDLWVI